MRGRIGLALVAVGSDQVYGAFREFEADLGLVRVVGCELMENMEEALGLVETAGIAAICDQAEGASR